VVSVRVSAYDFEKMRGCRRWFRSVLFCSGVVELQKVGVSSGTVTGRIFCSNTIPSSIALELLVDNIL